MDSGYLASGEMLEDDYDILKDLLPEEVIGIMDQMLCFEVSYCPVLYQNLRTNLILIIGFLDGMAYGKSTLTNNIYFALR